MVGSLLTLGAAWRSTLDLPVSEGLRLQEELGFVTRAGVGLPTPLYHAMRADPDAPFPDRTKA